MKTSAKKVVRAFRLETKVLAKMQSLADSSYGGNLTAAIEDAIDDALAAKTGPLSKVFEFNAEIRAALKRAGVESAHVENGVDWFVPSLRLGIEGKVDFAAGASERRTLSAMSYTVGKQLVDEIWIVGSDSISREDRLQWERAARDFHLCKARFIFGSELERELKQRMKSLGSRPAAPAK